MLHSPSHQLKTIGAEAITAGTQDDATQFAGILVVNRKGNAGTMHVGGPEVTATTGGKDIDPSDGYLVQHPRGLPVRLTDVFVAGAVGDWVDTICYPLYVP
jgi:hypothetical protein